MCASIASSPTTTRSVGEQVRHDWCLCTTWNITLIFCYFHLLPFSVSCSHICNGFRTAITTPTVLCVIIHWLLKTLSDWSAMVRSPSFCIFWTHLEYTIHTHMCQTNPLMFKGTVQPNDKKTHFSTSCIWKFKKININLILFALKKETPPLLLWCETVVFLPQMCFTGPVLITWHLGCPSILLLRDTSVPPVRVQSFPLPTWPAQLLMCWKNSCHLLTGRELVWGCRW